MQWYIGIVVKKSVCLGCVDGCLRVFGMGHSIAIRTVSLYVDSHSKDESPTTLDFPIRRRQQHCAVVVQRMNLIIAKTVPIIKVCVQRNGCEINFFCKDNYSSRNLNAKRPASSTYTRSHGNHTKESNGGTEIYGVVRSVRRRGAVLLNLSVLSVHFSSVY